MVVLIIPLLFYGGSQPTDKAGYFLRLAHQTIEFALREVLSVERDIELCPDFSARGFSDH